MAAGITWLYADSDGDTAAATKTAAGLAFTAGDIALVVGFAIPDGHGDSFSMGVTDNASTNNPTWSTLATGATNTYDNVNYPAKLVLIVSDALTANETFDVTIDYHTGNAQQYYGVLGVARLTGVTGALVQAAVSNIGGFRDDDGSCTFGSAPTAGSLQLAVVGHISGDDTVTWDTPPTNFTQVTGSTASSVGSMGISAISSTTATSTTVAWGFEDGTTDTLGINMLLVELAASGGAPSTEAPAGVATGTGAAHAPVPSVAAGADVATGTGAAANPGGTGNAEAGTGTGTGAAADPAPSVAVAAEVAAGTGAAADPGGTGNAEAGSGAGTGESGGAAAGVAPHAEAGTGTGAADDATISTSSATSAVADVATGTGDAHGPAPTVAPNAETGTGTGTGHDGTTSAVSDGSAAASVATGTGTALEPGISASSLGDVAAGTGDAHGPTPTVGAAAGTPPDGLGGAYDAAGAVGATGSPGDGTGAADGTTGAVAASTVTATGTGAGHDATVSTATQAQASAEAATGTGTALEPGISAAPVVDAATGTGTAADALAVPGGTAAAETATGAGAAAAATAGVGPSPDPATGTGTGHNADGTVPGSADALVAEGTGQAYTTGPPSIELEGRRPTGGGWGDLLGILHEEAATSRATAGETPRVCPNDGTVLEVGPGGRLFCPWDGWSPSGPRLGGSPVYTGSSAGDTAPDDPRWG